MKTKEFAKLCGVEKRTLFHYDEIGLLKPIIVRENGYREYAMEQLGHMDMIKIFQASGYSLAEIKNMMFSGSSVSPQQLRNACERIDNQIRSLEEMKDYLVQKEILLSEFQALSIDSCQIATQVFRYDQRAVSLDNHFFSFLTDGTYSVILIDSCGEYHICKRSANGKYTKSGNAISFFLKVPSQEPSLEGLIRERLLKWQFEGDNNFYIESLPHFTTDAPSCAILKVTVFEKQNL